MPYSILCHVFVHDLHLIAAYMTMYNDVDPNQLGDLHGHVLGNQLNSTCIS